MYYVGLPVISAKQENKAREGMRVETGWLEYEKAIVPASRMSPSDGWLSYGYNKESPGGPIGCTCLGPTSKSLI